MKSCPKNGSNWLQFLWNVIVNLASQQWDDCHLRSFYSTVKTSQKIIRVATNTFRILTSSKYSEDHWVDSKKRGVVLMHQWKHIIAIFLTWFIVLKIKLQHSDALNANIGAAKKGARGLATPQIRSKMGPKWSKMYKVVV